MDEKQAAHFGCGKPTEKWEPMQKQISLLYALTVATLFSAISGCARTNMTSEVKPDGSLTRTVVFKGSPGEPAKSASGGNGATISMETSMGPKLTDLVILPTAPTWTVTRSQEEKDLVITATQTVPPGQTLSDDLGVKGTKPGAPAALVSSSVAGGKKPVNAAPVLLLSNTVTVKETRPGHLEYREVIRWRGEKPKDLTKSDTEMDALLKKSLPASATSDAAVVQRMGASLQREMWQLIFGPNEPLLASAMLHPELAVYRIQRRLTGAVDKSLNTEYGATLSEAERKAAAEKIVAALTASSTNRVKKSAESSGPMGSEDEESANTGMVAMLFRVKMPGKVVATNGDADPHSNEVVWAMYAMAPAAGDIVLTAECEVGK